MHIIYLLTGWKYFNMKKYWFSNFVLDTVTWAPFLILPSMFMINNLNQQNTIDTGNNLFNFLTLYACLILPFLFLVNSYTITANSEGLSKDEKKFKKIETFIVFLDIIFVFSLTTLTCISVKELFMLTCYMFVIIKLRYIILLRTHLIKI